MTKQYEEKPPYTRTQGFLGPASKHTYKTVSVASYWNQADVTTTNSAVVAPPGDVFGDLAVGVVTPGYKRKSNSGALIVTPFNKVHAEYNIAQTYTGDTLYLYNNFSPRSTGQHVSTAYKWVDGLKGPSISFPSPNIDIQRDAALQADAVNTAFANSHQRNVMGMVDIAEAGKTADLIMTNVGRMKSLHKIVKSSKTDVQRMLKGKLRYLSKKNKAVINWRGISPAAVMADSANLWLEVQYGLIPTMLSIEGLVKTLGELSQQAATRQTFRGSSSYHDKYQLKNLVNRLVNTISWQDEYILDAEQNYYCRAGVITDYKPGLAAKLGMEFRDIIPGAYELIPYSFVLDWAFDLGTYLEAVTPVKGYNNLASWSTLIKEDIHQYTYHQPFKAGSFMSGSVQYFQTASEIYTQFSVIHRTSDRIPGVLPQLPHLDTQMKSLTHIISGAALAFSFATRGRIPKGLRL